MPRAISQIAQDVIAGKFGNGDARKARLIAAGYDYNAVQAEVNRILGGGDASQPSENITIDVDLTRVKSITLNFKG